MPPSSSIEAKVLLREIICYGALVAIVWSDPETYGKVLLYIQLVTLILLLFVLVVLIHVTRDQRRAKHRRHQKATNVIPIRD